MRQNDKENPFIHLFQTAFGYYLYDVNTNQIIKIKQDTYERLSNQEKVIKLILMRKLKYCMKMDI